MTSTFQMARDLGWDYLEKLAKQNMMQVQSASDPPKKLALGERAVQADGNEYNLLEIKEKGPVEIVYATEGTPLHRRSQRHLQGRAATRTQRKLFQCYCFTAGVSATDRRCRQAAVVAPVRSRRTDGRKPIHEIKFMKEDAAAVEKQAEEIKASYSKMFRV